MHSQFLHSIVAATALAVASANSTAQAEELLPVLLEEDFAQYPTGTAAKPDLAERWNFRGSQPTIVVLSDLSPDPILALPNGLMVAELRSPLRKIVAEVELLHAKYERAQWFGFFDQELTKGYVVVWDSSIPGSFDSAGFLTLRKVDLDLANPRPDQLTFLLSEVTERLGRETPAPRPEARDGQRAVTPPFAKVSLMWTKDGLLTVAVDGQSVLDVNDTDFSGFHSFVIAGNDKGFFKSVRLSGE